MPPRGKLEADRTNSPSGQKAEKRTRKMHIKRTLDPKKSGYVAFYFPDFSFHLLHSIQLTSVIYTENAQKIPLFLVFAPLLGQAAR
jgi:hypothetical protein